jgi:transposase
METAVQRRRRVRPPHFRRVYLRFEVEPAEQAQVDWCSFGHMRVGTAQRPLSVFTMVMQQMETFLRMHRRALEFFAGIPRRIVYDNLKSVVLHRVGSTVQFNPRFLAFAGHYLFEVTAAPVRYPEFTSDLAGIILALPCFAAIDFLEMGIHRTSSPRPRRHVRS